MNTKHNDTRDKDGLKMINREEVQRRIEQGVQIVNVLDPKYYNLGSIKGSLKIPVSELIDRISELDKNLEVVTYCMGQECLASKEGGKILAKKGFRVSVYEGGITDWKNSGLPLEMKSVAPLKSKLTPLDESQNKTKEKTA